MSIQVTEITDGFFRYIGPFDWTYKEHIGSTFVYVECLDPKSVLVYSEDRDSPILYCNRKVPMEQWRTGNFQVHWTALNAVERAKELVSEHSK